MIWKAYQIMWKPIEMDFCIDCDAPQPPLFDLPPPPMPPTLTMANCIEQSGYASCNNLMVSVPYFKILSILLFSCTFSHVLKALSWRVNESSTPLSCPCFEYPIFVPAWSTYDYSYFQFTDINYDALSMQTTAITLLCSVLFLIFIFVSSIFVWKWVNFFFFPIPTIWSHEVAWIFFCSELEYKFEFLLSIIHSLPDIDSREICHTKLHMLPPTEISKRRFTSTSMIVLMELMQDSKEWIIIRAIISL